MAINSCIVTCFLTIGLSLATASDFGQGVQHDQPLQRIRDCFKLADAVRNYVQYLDKENPYVNIAQGVEWVSSIDLNNLHHVRLVACGISGRSAAEIAQYAETSGIAKHLVRRGYGYGIMYYHMERERWLAAIEQSDGDKDGVQFQRLVIDVFQALDKRGFLCLENRAEAEVIAWLVQLGLAVDPEVIHNMNCNDFKILARDLFSYMVKHNEQEVIELVEATTGQRLADTDGVGQIMCDIAESDSFNDIVSVINRFGMLEEAILYGALFLPDILGPTSHLELVVQLTDDDELLENFPYLHGATADELAEFRKSAWLIVNLKRELVKLSNEIRQRQKDTEASPY